MEADNLVNQEANHNDDEEFQSAEELEDEVCSPLMKIKSNEYTKLNINPLLINKGNTNEVTS